MLKTLFKQYLTDLIINHNFITIHTQVYIHIKTYTKQVKCVCGTDSQEFKVITLQREADVSPYQLAMDFFFISFSLLVFFFRFFFKNLTLSRLGHEVFDLCKNSVVMLSSPFDKTQGLNFTSGIATLFDQEVYFQIQTPDI